MDERQNTHPGGPMRPPRSDGLRRRTWLAGAAVSVGLALAAWHRSARAQANPPGAAWTPDGPVRVVVGALPGGSTDLLARMLAESARSQLEQPVVVENASGAGGNIAAAGVARAKPEGRTFLFGYGALVINHLRGDPPGAVDPLRQLIPVARRHIAGGDHGASQYRHRSLRDAGSTPADR
jgi:Tripartite tricarboxylate transporter family receptor